MSFRFASEQLADLRRHAQLLIEHAVGEGQLEALVAATEKDWQSFVRSRSKANVVRCRADNAGHSCGRARNGGTGWPASRLRTNRLESGDPVPGA